MYKLELWKPWNGQKFEMAIIAFREKKKSMWGTNMKPASNRVWQVSAEEELSLWWGLYSEVKPAGVSSSLCSCATVIQSQGPLVLPACCAPNWSQSHNMEHHSRRSDDRVCTVNTQVGKAYVISELKQTDQCYYSTYHWPSHSMIESRMQRKSISCLVALERCSGVEWKDNWGFPLRSRFIF